MSERNLVSFDAVSYHIDGKSIIYDITFDIKYKDLITIIGSNGSGKTTIAKLIISAITPTKGKITKQANLSIGYMPQKIHFDPILPVRVIDFLKLKKLYKQNIDEILSLINIKKLFDVQLYNLSGGELQKILLVASIINKPKLLIIDEPTQGLDINSQSEFYKLIDYIRGKFDITILMISHDLHMVMKATDYVLCINKHICCKGIPKNIVTNPEFMALFDRETINNFAAYTHHHNHSH